MVAASLASLALAGSFVEVGKRDIWSAARMAQERPDVKYHLVAVDFLPPQTIHRNLLKLTGMLAAGVLLARCLPGCLPPCLHRIQAAEAREMVPAGLAEAAQRA